jgi:hypothetical protein
MRRAAVSLSLLALALGASACGEREEPEVAAAAEPAFEITGDWEGRISQRAPKPVELRATIDSLERSKQNVVRYSETGCSGTWDYLGATETAYQFRETIDSGGAKCRGTGTVELTPVSDDSVEYGFEGAGVGGRGVLERT